ncbi:MAG: arabinogalactan endo-1,4-beta-galactosidase [Cyclobacteriaceae bacterium]|jgi:arabinogalactan endo-1,4-beta-galactosidase
MKRLAENIALTLIIITVLVGCKGKFKEGSTEIFYLGGDLSYVNEMIDCGAEYRINGELIDPYELFGKKGANISRLRLWHNPKWTNYSDYSDVELAIERSKKNGMAVLLDFHYSDTWADPQHQVIPKAWENISELSVLADSLYKYTYQTLHKLHEKDLLPEFVQVGNEINIEILQDSASMVVDTINWKRDLTLINAGLKAVADFCETNGTEVGTMIHIAQPENALWWFAEAEKFGIANFDWIGLSYYPKWSIYSLDSLSIAIDSLIKTYNKKLMIVETAYPYTLENFDEGHNILGKEALISGYDATPKGQYSFMKKLKEITFKSGGKGVIYWEPCWVSTACETPWNKGSNWENATYFDAANNNEALPVFDLFESSNDTP